MISFAFKATLCLLFLTIANCQNLKYYASANCLGISVDFPSACSSWESVGFSGYVTVSCNGDSFALNTFEDSSCKTPMSSASSNFAGQSNQCITLGSQASIFVKCDSSSSKCFPATSKVITPSGVKQMSELQIGDKVLVSNNTFSEVYMFSHKYENSVNEFIQIQTELLTIKLTADHYLYVNGRLATAKTVQLGDKLNDAFGNQVTVKHISTQKDNGLYNPHTLHGDIVVDGIVTSTYTAAVSPSFAHTMLAPIRMLYNMGIDIMSEKFNEGANALVDVLPKGEQKY